MDRVLSIILGGGMGTRLFPLTKDRAKPAVPFGAKYRLVDIPISNCINSRYMSIYILTQFNSSSLHLHIARTFRFDHFSKGFIEILAAVQSFDNTSGWYEGTADAVRKNFVHFERQEPEQYMILSGDQLYRMNLREFIKEHRESNADITVAATPVTRESANDLGILKTDGTGRIDAFEEKPGPEKDISHLRIPAGLQTSESTGGEKEYLASMGIYIFNRKIMKQCLDNDYKDFGKEVFPLSIEKYKVHAYVYNGFWEDIGTIRSFFETNLNLASISPDFNLYDEENPIYTHRRDLPPSKFNSCVLKQTVSAEGSIINDSSISNSLLGVRTIIDSGVELQSVYCMGADWYESDAEKRRNRETNIPDIGIGKGCQIKNAIIDKNARIGEGCRIGTDHMDRTDGDFGHYFIREGVIIIDKQAIIPPGTII